tara:strand:+ start:1765 stop:4056 length:2292 start_codon:yes stop_codon:yes gene_type:complete
MAKKKLFKNFPTTDKRGHYFYYDDELQSIQDSNSLPIGLDKFNNSALYTSVQDSLINKLILKYGLGKLSKSEIKINKLSVANSGVSKATANTRLDVWLFDNKSWDLYSDQPGAYPETRNEGGLNAALYGDTGGYLGAMGKNMTAALRVETADAPAISARIFRYRPGDIDEGEGMGVVLKDSSVLRNLANTPPDVGDIGSTQDEVYSPDYAFSPATTNALDTTDQFIYIVVRTAGNGRKKNAKDKSRDTKYQIYKIPSFEFYDSNQDGKAGVYPLNAIKTTEGAGDYQAAFSVDELELYVDTRTTFVQDYPTEANDNDNSLTWNNNENAIPNYSYNEIQEVLKDVQEPLRMNLRNLNEEFRTQLPNREIIGHKFLGTGNNNSFDKTIQKDFEPVTKVNIVGNSEYDVSAYQEDEIARQICSAPNQVELGFYISDYINGEGDLAQTDGYGIGKEENYKFYVLDWNDVDNKFTNSEEYLNDIPDNNIDMLEKQNQSLYKFADLSETLIHNYSTPGMKIIKSVLFSHLSTYENSQVVRWKFIETRIYLDIPITKFPDFGELGGRDFTTIPWPYTTPIIGGVSENSKYKTSIQNTLRGGKLTEKEIIDIRFLTAADKNDELGKSIQKMDLEQVRFIIGPSEGEGTYDMHTLLGINNNIVQEGNFYPYTDTTHWDCKDWNINRNYCFLEESSVGQIFIDDNSDLDLKRNCTLELNLGNLDGKTINDTNGNPNKGIMIGDYKIKKRQKNVPMKRDSFIKLPKKGTSDGAL